MENKGNKELQDVLKDLFNIKSNTINKDDGTAVSIGKFVNSMKPLISKVEKGMPNYSKEVRDMLKPILKEVKAKSTIEHFDEIIANMKTDANNSN